MEVRAWIMIRISSSVATVVCFTFSPLRVTTSTVVSFL